MSNLTQRAITAVIFAAVMLCGLSLHPIGFIALMGILTLGCLWEFIGLTSLTASPPMRVLSIIPGLVPFVFYLREAGIGVAYPIHTNLLFGFLTVWVLLLFIMQLYHKSERPWDNIAYPVLGVFYIGMPFAMAIPMVVQQQGVTEPILFSPWLLIFVIFAVWTNDVFAYLGGRQFGKTKLFERISPKKTWEGTAIGLVMTMLLSLVTPYIIPPNPWIPLGIWEYPLIALVAGVAGSYGDLAESMLKRSLGIKDSGKLLPGHGGLLDRFDALLFAIPIVSFYLSVRG